MEKLKVFISSRGEELNDERAIAKEAVEHFNFEPVMYEKFGSRTESPKGISLKLVRESDVYLGIFYREYSELTEEEYKEARELNKDILIYIKNVGGKRRNKSLNNLLREIKDIKSGHAISKFDDIVELREKIKIDLSSLVARRFLEAKPPYHEISPEEIKKKENVGYIIDIFRAMEYVKEVEPLKAEDGARFITTDKFYHDFSEELGKRIVKITKKMQNGLKPSIEEIRIEVMSSLVILILKKIGPLTLNKIREYFEVLYFLATGANENQFLRGLLNLLEENQEN